MTSGMNLYRKMKKAIEKITLSVIIHPEISLDFVSSFTSSFAASFLLVTFMF